MDLLTGNVRKLYFKFLSAAFGSALISSIYGMVDMAMVGQYQGPDGAAALAVVAPVWNIIYSLGLLTGIGGSVLFSARRGGGQSDNEANEYFTVGFYPQEYRRDLMILGSKSGRDGDKVALTHLTPRAVEHGVTFAQAKLTLICKKIYRHDMELANIPADAAKAYYAEEAPHTIYIGEVVGFVES